MALDNYTNAVIIDGSSGTAVTLGTKTAANSIPVTSASDDPGNGAAASVSRILSAAASTNGTSAKASAGWLRFITGKNASVAERFLKFYNKASAPTVGTDTPVMTIVLPPNTYFTLRPELYFATGIAYALTTAAADADTGALTAADIICLNVGYQ